MEPATRTPATSKRRSRYEGIVLRHSRGCRSRTGERCSCSPTFQAQVWSSADQKTIRKTFGTLTEARSWRHESQVALRKGMLRSASPLTLREAADAWLLAAAAGSVRTRTGEAYKPSAVRAYRQALNHRALPTLGTKKLSAIDHTMLQDFADRLSAQGLSASSVRNTILEQFVVEAVLYRLDSPELAAAMSGESGDPDAERWQAEIDQSRAQVDELAAMYGRREIGLTEWQAARTPIERRVTDAKKQLVRLTRTTALAGQIRSKHAIVAAVLEHITVASARRGFNRFDSNRFTVDWRA